MEQYAPKGAQSTENTAQLKICPTSYWHWPAAASCAATNLSHLHQDDLELSLQDC